jgi:hypothetical protein
VLPTGFEKFLPDQPNTSAAGLKIWPHIKFTHKGQIFFATKILTPWQHCLPDHRLLIGKTMQLEKKDAAKSKIGAT